MLIGFEVRIRLPTYIECKAKTGRRGREENDMQVVDAIVERREYGSLFMKCRKFRIRISDISF